MRVVLWMGSIVVALAAVLGASRLWAESKEKKPAPRTRIGLVNLTYVINQYEKFQQFKEEIKKIAEPYQKRDAELRSKLEELRKQAEDPSLVRTAGKDRREKSKKEKLEEKVKQIQREIEDNQAESKVKMGKQSDDQMKILYIDVYEAARNYATAHELDLVLQYNDPITREDYLSAQSLARRFNTGGLKPLYMKEGMEISRDLVTLLNQKMHKK